MSRVRKRIASPCPDIEHRHCRLLDVARSDDCSGDQGDEHHTAAIATARVRPARSQSDQRCDERACDDHAAGAAKVPAAVAATSLMRIDAA